MRIAENLVVVQFAFDFASRSIFVIRNPLRTKKSETPISPKDVFRKIPLYGGEAQWNQITARTAKHRNPSN
jgi:hypothetical protein